MVHEETVTVDGFILRITETVEQVKEEYSVEQIDNEIASIQSEISNFELIQSNRLAHLNAKLAKFQSYKTAIEAPV